jgi:hypothetical protein
MKKIVLFFLTSFLILILLPAFLFAQKGIVISCFTAKSSTVGTKQVPANSPIPNVGIKASIVVNGKNYPLGNNLKTDSKGNVVILNPRTLLKSAGLDLTKTPPPYQLEVYITSFTESTEIPNGSGGCILKISNGNVPLRNVAIPDFPPKIGVMSGPYGPSLSNLEDN